MIPTTPDVRPTRNTSPHPRPSPRAGRQAILAFALLAGPGGAWATTSCGTLSPTLERLGADYLLLEEGTRPAADDPDSLERLLVEAHGPLRTRARRLAQLSAALETASLDGLDGERVRCRGTGAALREVRWQFDIEQLERVERLDGPTLLTAFEARHTVTTDRRGDAFGDDRLVGGTRVAEVMDVPPAGAWRAGADGRTLRSSRRFRRAGAGPANCPLAFGGTTPAGCSYLTEVDTTARAVGGAIELEQVFYIQGRWSERVLWRLGS